MQALQGRFDNARPITAPFLRVALEYLSLSDTSCWQFVPHILVLSDPSDERFITKSRRLSRLFKDEAADHKSDMRFHRRNLLIEIRERRAEVLDALKSMPEIVLNDALMPFGLRDNRYHIGLVLRPADVKTLQNDMDFRNCTIRPIIMRDLTHFIGRHKPVLQAA
jgi:hypothetical protein